MDKNKALNAKSPHDVPEIMDAVEGIEKARELASKDSNTNDLKHRTTKVIEGVQFYNPSIAHIRWIQYACLKYVNNAEIADVITYILSVDSDDLEDIIGMDWDNGTLSRNARKFANAKGLDFDDCVRVSNLLYFDLLDEMDLSSSDNDDGKKNK
jgi:hypothetical protein